MPATSAPLGPPTSSRSSSRFSFESDALRRAILRSVYRGLTCVAVAVLAIGCSERETPMAPSEQGPGPYGLSWDDGAGDESTGSSSAAPLRTHPLPATADFVNGSL